MTVDAQDDRIYPRFTECVYPGPCSSGIRLWDYYAAAALACCAIPDSPKHHAQAAAQVADAMLRERAARDFPESEPHHSTKETK